MLFFINTVHGYSRNNQPVHTASTSNVKRNAVVAHGAVMLGCDSFTRLQGDLRTSENICTLSGWGWDCLKLCWREAFEFIFIFFDLSKERTDVFTAHQLRSKYENRHFMNFWVIFADSILSVLDLLFVRVHSARRTSYCTTPGDQLQMQTSVVVKVPDQRIHLSSMFYCWGKGKNLLKSTRTFSARAV